MARCRGNGPRDNSYFEYPIPGPSRSPLPPPPSPPPEPDHDDPGLYAPDVEEIETESPDSSGLAPIDEDLLALADDDSTLAGNLVDAAEPGSDEDLYPEKEPDFEDDEEPAVADLDNTETDVEITTGSPELPTLNELHRTGDLNEVPGSPVLDKMVIDAKDRWAEALEEGTNTIARTRSTGLRHQASASLKELRITEALKNYENMSADQARREAAKQRVRADEMASFVPTKVGVEWRREAIAGRMHARLDRTMDVRKRLRAAENTKRVESENLNSIKMNREMGTEMKKMRGEVERQREASVTSVQHGEALQAHNSTLQEQVRELEEAHKQFKKLANELMTENQELKDEHKDLKTQNEGLKTTLESRERKAANQADNISNLKQDLQKANNEIETLKKKLEEGAEDCQKEKEELTKSVTEATEQIKLLEQKLRQSAEDCQKEKDLRESIAVATEQIKSLEEKLRQAAEACGKEKESLIERIKQLGKDNTELQDEKDSLEQQAIDFERSNMGLEENSRKLQREIEKLKEENEELKKETEQLKKQNESLLKSFEHQTKIIRTLHKRDRDNRRSDSEEGEEGENEGEDDEVLEPPEEEGSILSEAELDRQVADFYESSKTRPEEKGTQGRLQHVQQAAEERPREGRALEEEADDGEFEAEDGVLNVEQGEEEASEPEDEELEQGGEIEEGEEVEEGVAQEQEQDDDEEEEEEEEPEPAEEKSSGKYPHCRLIRPSSLLSDVLLC